MFGTLKTKETRSPPRKRAFLNEVRSVNRMTVAVITISFLIGFIVGVVRSSKYVKKKLYESERHDHAVLIGGVYWKAKRSKTAPHVADLVEDEHAYDMLDPRDY
jgi:hypothetical protein